MKTTLKKVVGLACLAALTAAPGCDKAKSTLAAAAGKMTFTGTVNRAGTTVPVKGANVILVPLATVDAIKALVEVRKIPDGSGGQKDRLRVKIDQVQSYIKSHDTVKTTTGDNGKFSVQADVNVYLVYTYGPDGGPGSAADAYGPAFWGINPDTGELDKDHLIGADLKLTQNNDKIQLPGGPVPPAPPPAATPQAKPNVTPPAAPAAPTATQAEPKAGDTLPPGNLIPPARTDTFFSSIKLTYNGGAIGTGEASMETDSAPLIDGQRYLQLDADLAAAQTDPVYLVIQKGFDSTYVTGCDTTVTAATTRVYPVTVNGTHISYELVPPGPFYKFFLAKKATQASDGVAPTDVTSPSDTLTVGARTCANAVPERPFLATLSWDAVADIDLHVSKFDAAKVNAATTADDVGAALVDQANYMYRQGTTLSLDVDNVYAYGPENNGDSKDEAHPENYCYLVKINYFAGSASPVNANVDVTYVTTDNGKKYVKQLSSKVQLTASGDWKTIGAYGPTPCAKLLNPPPSPSDIMAYPSASSCVTPASCDLTGDQSGKYTATVAVDKATYSTSDTVKVDYSNMPDLSGNWITIVPKTQVDNSWCSWQWAAGTSGTQYYGSLPAGTYEVRLYYNWSGGSGAGGGQCEVIGRKSFTVQ